MATSPANILQVVSKPAGKGVTGYASLVDAAGNELLLTKVAKVANSATDTAANVATTVNALRDAMISAGIMKSS